MINIYKYGFFVFLICLVTLINLGYVYKIGLEKDIKKYQGYTQERILSLLNSNSIDEREIRVVNGIDIITNKEKDEIIKDTTLVILLSEPKCNKCQAKEIKRLNILKKTEDLYIVGITIKKNKNIVGIQKKYGKVDFPFYWVDDITFNKLTFDNEFPQVLYIVDGIVQSAFQPVPMDDEFSEMYYVQLLNVINGKH